MILRYIPALLGVLLLCSCSSSTEESTTGSTPSNSVYFPLSTNNYWTYTVDAMRDSLYIANDTLIASTPHKKCKAKDFPVGFYSNSLNKNGIRKSGDEILASGTFDLEAFTGLPIAISLNNFIIFKENATTGQTLSNVTGTLQQTVQDLPLTIQYKTTSIAGVTFPNYTSPNGDAYTNVKAVNTIINLQVSTVYFGIPFVVLPSQDVLVSTQYFAKDIGVVHTNTHLQYALSSGIPAGIPLPIPNSGNQTQQEFLDDYHIN
ncbi:hypothetical protein E6C50_15640 [Flavobacterium supellecticarium]|uniref:Lipoprotein n=1 Tax=Flavobacterium supellecticarium TaxID=2565924 RepID=A0A4S3ZQQ1_9FLAO|nr:hypothetical protein [Flavobacterium supellecticarium]THF47866.1 hypothetical protein E6C50_15640 [Flavobacterium supellecticarium]